MVSNRCAPTRLCIAGYVLVCREKFKNTRLWPQNKNWCVAIFFFDVSQHGTVGQQWWPTTFANNKFGNASRLAIDNVMLLIIPHTNADSSSIPINCQSSRLTWNVWLMFFVPHSAKHRFDKSISSNSSLWKERGMGKRQFKYKQENSIKLSVYW
jgi:hypothetical protein